MNRPAVTSETGRRPRVAAARPSLLGLGSPAAAVGLGALVAAIGLGACVAGASSSGAPGSPAGSASASLASPSAGGTQAAPAATRTVTGWGSIWDALPPSFPVYPGAEPVPDPAGASTAALAVPASTAAAATWWERALESGGFGGLDVSKPLEDGSVVVDATGSVGCRVRVRVTPTGATTTATILYGAACPST